MISKCDMVTSVLQVGDDVPVQDNKVILQHTLALQSAGDYVANEESCSWPVALMSPRY